MNLRVLIVDDEPWARKRIATLLKPERGIEIVGQSDGGEDAIKKISELSPDLVFLDVQMPDVDGFEVIEAIGPDRMPLVIFATAFDKYALRAFDANALDYLLKPFDEERFHKALSRARAELQNVPRAAHAASLQALLQQLRGTQRHLRRLVVKSGGRVLFLKTSDVDWFEASGNYIGLHIGREVHLIRESMNGLEAKLDPDQFVRIHRSTIVNLDRVKQLQPWFRGEQVLVLNDGTQLTVGRSFRARLRELIENTVH